MPQGKRKFSVGLIQVFNDYRGNCRRRNVFFDISKEALFELTQRNCFYCDKPPELSNNRHGKFFYNGLDRKNNEQGYTINNVVPCCKECNGLRSSHLTIEEMRVVALALKKFRLRNSD